MKRNPLLRRAPLRAKAPPPRYAAIKARPKPAPPAIDKRHMGRIADMPCLVCGGRATVHHVTSDGMKRITRSDRRTVPLCPVHHQIQHGPRESVEALGHAGFTLTYGIDLLAVADRLWTESEAQEMGR